MMTNLQSSAFVAKTTQLLSSVARLRLLLVMLLTLTASTAWGETVTFTPSNCTNWTSSQAEQTQTIDGITLHSTGAANNTQLRLYSGATHTFTSTVGNITSILFTCTTKGTNNYGPGKMTGDGYVASNGYTGEWTGNSAEVTLTGGQSRCTSIVVTYTPSSGGGGSTPTQLTAPTGLTVDAITSSGATLSWDAVANASSYVVTIVDGGSLKKDYPVTGITTTVSDLESSTDYLWTVTAVGDGINYTNSEESSEIGEFTTSAAGGGGGDGGCTWELVTDASTLKAGDRVVIAANGYDYAISTSQGNNNRGQAAITKSTSNGKSIISVPNVDVQILTLENGTTSGTFAFNTGDGYLYAASSSSNYLRTQTTNNANGSWKITISNNTATIVAQGSYTRNTMQYNQQSSIFACYASASQKALAIYKEVCTTETVVTLIPKKRSIGTSLKTYYFL